VIVRSLEDARDHELVRRVKAGDEGAFRDLYRRYSPLAGGLAMRMVRHPFVAEEIVQEAFLALWRNPDAYREERGTFRAWLMSAVHHRAVDAIRREETQRRRAGPSEALESILEDVAQSVVEEAAAAGAREQVRAALREIPPEQRQVLEMMYFKGRTQAQVAQELDLPLGTVKSRTLLGMRRLRTLLLEREE